MVIFLTSISLPDRLREDRRIIDLDVFFLPIPVTHFSSQVPIYTEFVNKETLYKTGTKNITLLSIIEKNKNYHFIVGKKQYILKSNL